MPFEIIRGTPSPFLFVADHASNRVPPEMGDLGVCDADMARHIAWDIGTAELARTLVSRVGGAGVLSTVSRLVIDKNREEDHPGLIPRVSDETIIPANHGLTDEEKERRLEAYFRPYHRAIHSEIEARLARGQGPVLIALHSFTPAMNGFSRPWHVGLLSNQDRRLTQKALTWFQEQPDLVVGDNEPYSGVLLNATMNRHAEARGLLYLSLEIRQDLLLEPEGISLWAERLERMLQKIG